MATDTASKELLLATEELTQAVLDTIEREREREIISRRFGLLDRKETLEQIGELLGITRERVRQLEKSVVSRLKASAEAGEISQITTAKVGLVAFLEAHGTIARVSKISEGLTAENSKTDQARIAFLASLTPGLVAIDETDDFFQAVGLESARSEKAVKTDVAQIIEAIKKGGLPINASELAKATSLGVSEEVAALASISKKLATLNGLWGLVKWPLVNPKNIRDKIYVILKENGKHMHFNEIAEAIKDSNFKRKDVTTQAIHNELIKDKRFVLVGRGIYALSEWGYKKGTVADIITDILKKAGEPLHRDEIVNRVLESRYVKETTILLNLQGKDQFKRVAKATYTLADETAA